MSELVWLQSQPPKTIRAFWEKNYPGMKTLPDVLNLIPECGYDLSGHFTLPEKAWWNYYLPLPAKINYLGETDRNNSEALAVLENEQLEIEMYREYHDWYGYEFIVLQ